MPNSLELNVSPALLHTFANHPFHVRKDMEMNELVDSIRESGVIVPLIVRSRPEGGYEIISGHRRCEACRELGIEKVPVRVQELTDDEATILMVNSNIQREHVLPSEKAFAYKMKMDAMKHQGRATSCQLGTKLRTDGVLAESSSDSARTIQRYIRLTYLISPILQMVDESRMAFNPAVEISYMTPEHQRWLQAEMELCEATPSLVQSRRLKEMSQSGTLTEHYLHTLLTEQKPNQRQKFFLNQSDVQRFFPPGYTPEQMQNTIFSLLKTWGHDYAQNKLKATDYRCAYVANMPRDYTPDKCFRDFNYDDRPCANSMPSLSVSDLIVMERGDQAEAMYVDAVGFKDVSRLFTLELLPIFSSQKRVEMSILSGFLHSLQWFGPQKLPRYFQA